MVNQCRLCHRLCGYCSPASWSADCGEIVHADGVSTTVQPVWGLTSYMLDLSSQSSIKSSAINRVSCIGFVSTPDPCRPRGRHEALWLDLSVPTLTTLACCSWSLQLLP